MYTISFSLYCCDSLIAGQDLTFLTTYLLPVFATKRVGTHTVTKTAVAVENVEKIHITAEVFKNSSKGK